MNREAVMSMLDAGTNEFQRCYIEDVGFKSAAMVRPMAFDAESNRIFINRDGDHVQATLYVFFDEYDVSNDKYSSWLPEFPEVPVHIGSEDLSRILDYAKDSTLYLEIHI